MIPFLASSLFKIGAIAAVALAAWGYVAWLKHDAEAGWAAAEQHKANYATLRGAHEATLSAIDHIKANEAAATAARLFTEGKLEDARKQLAKSRRVVRTAPAAVAQCGLPPKLIALADSLRRPAPARDGGAGANDQATSPGRIAEAVPAGPGAAAR